jgi:hypothetical protein
MERIIGIDPGINFTGVAILEDGKVKFAKLINRKYDALPVNIDQQSCELAGLLQIRLDRIFVAKAVVEAPRIYPDSPARDNDQMDLSLMAGALFRAVSSISYAALLAYPRTWKGTTPKKIHNKRILEKLPELNELLKPYPKGQHEHIIDAAGLALWASEGKV